MVMYGGFGVENEVLRGLGLGFRVENDSRRCRRC